MIIDSLKGFEKYKRLHERFEAVFSYLRKTDFSKMAPGEYEIDGRNIYCKIEDAEARGFDDIKLEMHDVYIDIHILIEGNETIGFRDRSRCVGEYQNYDEINDIAFAREEPEVYVNLGPDNLVICFPSDTHAPMLGEDRIRKAVIKVKA